MFVHFFFQKTTIISSVSGAASFPCFSHALFVPAFPFHTLQKVLFLIFCHHDYGGCVISYRRVLHTLVTRGDTERNGTKWRLGTATHATKLVYTNWGFLCSFILICLRSTARYHGSSEDRRSWAASRAIEAEVQGPRDELCDIVARTSAGEAQRKCWRDAILLLDMAARDWVRFCVISYTPLCYWT